jgi:preprotein translocase subunit SecY
MLAVYRVGCFIPTPGINAQALAHFFAQAKGTLLGMFDMFSGGALEKLTVFALGIMPYISSSIIFQLLTVVIPSIEKLSKEGEAGRKKITQFTRYGTIVLSVIQAFGISIGLESMKGAAGELVVPNPGWGFRLLTVITLTAGTAFIMWMGEQMSEKGMERHFAHHICRYCSSHTNGHSNSLRLLSTGERSLFLIILVVLLMLAVVAGMSLLNAGSAGCYSLCETSSRPATWFTNFASSVKVNMTGLFPIFASSITMFLPR